LKACIAKGTQRHDFPGKKRVEASYTHNLRDLIKVANLEQACLEEAKKDPVFRNYWDLVQDWSEHSRIRGLIRKKRGRWWKRSAIENME